MLNAIAIVKNNYIGTGCLVPITVVLGFCATIRVVIPAEIQAGETPEYKSCSDFQALLMEERHTKRRDVKNIIPLSVSSGTSANIIGIKVYNLRSVYCEIQRRTKHAFGETVFKYDLAIFYTEAKQYKTYQIKDLSTLFSYKLEHIPPPEARLVSSCQAEVIDLLVPNSISQSRL